MKKISIVGVVIGVLTVIVGIIVLNMYTGSNPTSTSFGADFYTYIYRATRIAASNINDLGKILCCGLGFVLISMGLTEICVFLLMMKKNTQQPVTNYSPVIPLSNADELLKFKNLLDDGYISQEEFEAKKKQLLSL